MTWDDFYNFIGLKDLIYFVSSPELQDYLFPVKLIFLLFALFFLAGVIYFMINSSWLQYKFLEDVTEFLAWQSYGAKEMSKHWNKIKKRIESGAEADFKLALIEADEFFTKILNDAGFDEDTFEDSVRKAGKLFANGTGEIINAHEVRNSIVYNPDFKISLEQVKKLLNIYEISANSIGAK